MKMPTCRELYELLADLLEDKVDPSLRAEAEKHFRLCPDCECYLKTYKRSVECIRSADPPKMPEGLRNALQDIYFKARESGNA